MAQIEIIDTFPDFLAFWTDARHRPLETQIEGWATEYMARRPELLAKQVDDYESEGEDWQAIAQERVFPFLNERLPAMQRAHRNLLEACRPLYARAEEVLGFKSDTVFVIHVGIGCGAGWVTTYQGAPAILYGLENIAECGWSEPPALTGLIAHEIGHLAHFHWRAQHGVANGSGPWWQIYEEGFAQRCEHLVLGEDTWHMNDSRENGWLDWCHDHRRWLAAEFLRVVDEGGSVRPFFGSWYDFEGRSQTGYYLGHELIRVLETSLDLKEIALLDSQDPKLRSGLMEMAEGAVWCEISRI